MSARLDAHQKTNSSFSSSLPFNSGLQPRGWQPWRVSNEVRHSSLLEISSFIINQATIISIKSLNQGRRKR